MERRRLGRTGHQSTIITVGTAGFGRFDTVDQKQVDTAMEQFLAHGVNHVDIAPGYGQAMERMRRWMPKIRDKVFLGCKTKMRTKTEAWADIRTTFDRLQTDDFDLFQLHAVTTMAELDSALGPDGAIEALKEMRELGHTRYLGITGHGPYVPKVILEGLRRFDFDTVMFPVALAVWRDEQYRADANALIDYCNDHDVGIQCIKVLACGGWGSAPKDCSTWYDPLREQSEIDRAVNWLFANPIHTAPSTGEVSIVPKLLDAAERYQPLSESDQMRAVDAHQPRHPEPGLAIRAA